MKKIALSLFVIAASGGYVWNQRGQGSANDLLGPALQPAPQAQGTPRRQTSPSVALPRATASSPAAASLANPPTREQVKVASFPPNPAPVDALPLTPRPTVAPASRLLPMVDVPMPRLRPENAIQPKVTRAAMTVASKGSYADGSYTGPETDAYYGPMRIQATIQGGRLVSIKVLEYPSDRRTSVAINRQALPMLRDEVIAAQSAQVDIISGATLTSRAFIESLDAALGQAAGTSL
jgi:uncharacterized protein with FMN-binding domain